MAVARNNRHNAAFVVGSVLGAVAGAAVALWKTPYTGEELRSKLTSAGAHEGGESRTYVAPASTGVTTGEERSFKDKMLSGVEKTLAPIVGVELGKTANGSGAAAPTTMDSGEIKVSPEYGSTMLRHPHAWKDGSETAASTGAQDTHIGLSRDKVDPEKWAAAYGTTADTTTTQASMPVADVNATESGSSRLRPKRSWSTGSEDTAATSSEPVTSEMATGADTGKLGLSRDKVDAEKWAKAYGTDVPAGSTGATGSGYASKAEESAAQTGLGAKPAYPGSDQTGHAPVDRTAPDSNVADVGRGAEDIRTDSGLTVEDAASVDTLTTPQIDRIPDSMRTPDEGGYHPFPKLGGKDN